MLCDSPLTCTELPTVDAGSGVLIFKYGASGIRKTAPNKIITKTNGIIIAKVFRFVNLNSFRVRIAPIRPILPEIKAPKMAAKIAVSIFFS